MGVSGSRDPRTTIAVTCQIHGGAKGFTNLRVTKACGDIVLDPHVTGACVIVLDETAATALFDALGGVAGVTAMAEGDPWMQAWRMLEAFIDTGATRQEITEYARELGRGLPDPRDPQAYAQQAEAVQQVVREILS